MKKIFSLMLMALLPMMAINVQAEGYPVNKVLPTNVNITIGTAQQSVEPGKWYFIHTPRNRNTNATQFANVGETISVVGGLVTDNGVLNKIGVSATSVIQTLTSGGGATVNSFYPNLVRFIEPSNADEYPRVYRIQFATGRWFNTPTKGTGNTTSESSWYDFYPIKRNGRHNTAGRFGWNYFQMKNRVDNNGQGADVVFWGSGEIVAEEMDTYDRDYGDAGIIGNNVWQIYDVEILGDAEYYEILDMLASYHDMINKKNDGAFLTDLRNGVGVGSKPGNYKQAHVTALLTLHSKVGTLISNAESDGAKSALESYSTANDLQDLYLQYEYVYNKLMTDKSSVNIKPGYYTIRSMMNFNDGDIKYLCAELWSQNDGLAWGFGGENSTFLWKIEAVEGSNTEYRLVNMYKGYSFTGADVNATTQLKEDNSATVCFEYEGEGTAPVTGKNVTAYSIRNSQHTDNYSYIHCLGHNNGAASSGLTCGWLSSHIGSQWYLEEVDEATANQWIHGQFIVNGISYNIIGEDEAEVAFCCYGEHFDLKQVEIPSTVNNQGRSYKVTNIAEYAFYNSIDLTSLKIGENVKNIGYEAFGRCSNLKTVYLPSTLTSIEDYAFHDCTSLSKIYSNIPANKLVGINSTVFNGVDKNNCTLYVPSGAPMTYRNKQGWSEFKNIFTESGGSKVTSPSDFSNNYMYLVSLPYRKNFEWGVNSEGLYGCTQGQGTPMVFFTPNNGVDYYLYSPTYGRYINKDGGFSLYPQDQIRFANGAYDGTMRVYFDTSHIINVRDWTSGPWMVIDNWTTADGGNSCEFVVFDTFDPAALYAHFNMYNLSYMIDGEVHSSEYVAAGQAVKSIATPTKQGYDFSGWKGVPSIMPDNAVTVVGAFKKSGNDVLQKGYRVTSLSDFRNTVSYTVSVPWRKGYEWSIEDGQLVAAPKGTGANFAFVTPDEGQTFYLYSPEKNQFVSKAGELTEAPIDPIKFEDGAYTWTLRAYFDATHNININSQPKVVIDKWSLVDAGNSLMIEVNEAFDPTELYDKLGISQDYEITYMVDDKVYQTVTVKKGAKITPIEEPKKEGYTFSGWQDVPETMPAKDIVIKGWFTVNSYKVTYMVDGQVYHTASVAYGAKLPEVEAPVKEGHTFSGWQNVPATMPAKDVTITGSFSVNSYKVTYVVDGEVYHTASVAYGAKLPEVEAPAKEGHTFSGWSEIPATMPAKDVTITGSFSVNSYMVTYVVDGEVYHTATVAYGAKLPEVEAPAKEGHTFSGWSEIPATMPAKDVTITGSFSVNKYLVSFVIDGQVIKSEYMEYGAAIVAPEAPEKEGHTFNGWGEVAKTVPAEDVTYQGSYTVNVYKVYYYVGDDLVHTQEVAYGEVIPEYVYEPGNEGVFVEWIGEKYETMPAHDVTYKANIDTSIDLLKAQGSDLKVYDLNGRLLDNKNLKRGIYIVNGKKVAIK